MVSGWQWQISQDGDTWAACQWPPVFYILINSPRCEGHFTWSICCQTRVKVSAAQRSQASGWLNTVCLSRSLRQENLASVPRGGFLLCCECEVGTASAQDKMRRKPKREPAHRVWRPMWLPGRFPKIPSHCHEDSPWNPWQDFSAQILQK